MPTPSRRDAEPELTSFAAVSSLLWNERELLESVLFKLTVQRLVLASGSSRWLARATDEVNAVVGRISGTEVLRAAEIDALAETLHLPHETTLSELVAIAPEPWSTLLAEHRAALRSLVAEIEALGGEVRTLLSAGMKAIRETLDGLDSLGQAVGSYDATGATVNRASGPILLDEAL
jgi:hypothetical protein